MAKVGGTRVGNIIRKIIGKDKTPTNVNTGVYQGPIKENTSEALYRATGTTGTITPTIQYSSPTGPTKGGTYVSGGGSKTNASSVSSSQSQDKYYGGVVTSVPTLQKRQKVISQLLKLKRIQVQRERQQLQLKKVLYKGATTPLRNINKQIQQAKKREYGLSSMINKITEVQQKQRKKKIESQVKGKSTFKQDIIIGGTGVPKAILKQTRNTQTLIKNLPELSKKSVLFVSNKPLNKIYNSLKSIKYKDIKFRAKVGKKEFVNQIKNNPTEALTSGLINYFMLGGTRGGIKKAGKFLVTPEDIKAGEVAKKGIYLKVSPNERPVIFKFKRKQGVTLRDVQNKITNKLSKLRRNKKLVITTKTEKPILINLGEVRLGGKLKPKRLSGKTPKPPKYKTTTFNLKGVGKIKVIKNLNILRKQANKRLLNYKRIVRSKIKRISLNRPNKINLQALKNIKKKIKQETLFKKKTSKLLKRLIKRQSKKDIKLIKSIYKKRGLQYPTKPSKFDSFINRIRINREQRRFAKTTKYLENKERLKQKKLNNVLSRLIKKQSKQNIKIAKRVYKKYGLKFPTKKSKLKSMIDNFRVKIAQRRYAREERALSKKASRRYKKERAYKIVPLESYKQIQSIKSIKNIKNLVNRLRDKNLSITERQQLQNLYTQFRNRFPIKSSKAKLSIRTRTGKPVYSLTINGRKVPFKKAISKFNNISSQQKLALKRFKSTIPKQLKYIKGGAKGSIKVIRFAEDEISKISKGSREVGGTLKQIQIQKPVQKAIQKKVYIINDSIKEIQASINKLKSKKIRSKQALKQEIKRINKIKFKVYPLLYEASSSLARQLNKQKTKQIIKQPSASGQYIITGQVPRIGQVPRQKYSQTPKQAQRERQAFKQFIKEKTKQLRKRKRLIGLSGKKKITKLKRISPLIKSFNIYALSGKKYRKLNKKPLSRNDALSRGAYLVDNTTSKKLKLVPAKRVKSFGSITPKEKNYFNNKKYKLREYKVRRGKKISLKSIYIERRKYGIDTLGEKAGLSIASFLKHKSKTTNKRRHSRLRVPSRIVRSNKFNTNRRKIMLKNLAKARRVLAKNRKRR